MSNSYLSDYVDRLGDEEILITPDNAKDFVPAEPVVKEEESTDSAPNQPDQQSESFSKEEEQPKQEEKKEEVKQDPSLPYPYNFLGSLYQP